MKPDERGFEDTIESSLLSCGYLKSIPTNFDPILGLDTFELHSFIGATQPIEWEALIGLYGNDVEGAKRGFAKRLAKELDNRGTIDVLRNGVVDLGVTIQLAYFKPAHGLTAHLQDQFEANRVSITRQLPYEAGTHKTLDLTLFVNGIPTATAELKNPLTNQTVEHAIKQYRSDRDPTNITLSRRAVVHFAVDPDRVAMTTRLYGKGTRFLPFNLGNGGGAGNPPNPSGHRTSYLWERVWEREAWMDILARFIHVERTSQTSVSARRAAEEVIFPRFHQWDAVLKLETQVKNHGAGYSYLIEHSAGSGKSNTIAWTAHRLSSLHDSNDKKIFDKVIVISDRTVLDDQLQETIYQFDHVRGVVANIDKDSTQLAEAISGEQAQIVVTTIWKFPFVLDKIGQLPNRRYAVIIDEAHSSQTGEAAKDLRLVLGTTEEQELTTAEIEDAGFIAEAINPVEEALVKQVLARGKQKNLSFFAFTATPKARTLEMFGNLNSTTGRYEPFHLYSMRQAIEEGFILDVLANYTTYQTYWRIEKAISGDPTYEAPKARRSIARFVSLHPSNLAQKAEIIVEHFRTHTAPKIGGLAKAMIVTSSRLHAVRYKQTLDTYISKHDYTDVSTLVAFSGRVMDDKGLTYTEAGMNGFPEAQTADQFGTNDYQVLIVAEKFQTGFDQPLLHTMYVDKVLSGLATVQTLSRLNRIHPEKDDTFVLDFRNETEDIVAAFEPYYGSTIAPPSDPNLLYDTRARLDDFDVLRVDEIEKTVSVLLAGETKDHGAIYACLDPALERFNLLSEENQVAFRDALNRFVRTYSFVSQVVSFTDTKLERDYIYCRAFTSRIRDSATVERLDLGGEVELTHLRTQSTFSGQLTLSSDAGEVTAIYGEGRGPEAQPPMEHLSEIVSELNERFGLNLDGRDQLLFDQFEATWISNPDVIAQARGNSLENFRLVFDNRFMDTVVTRMDDNEAIFKRILDDDEFREVLMDIYAERVYRQSRRTE